MDARVFNPVNVLVSLTAGWFFMSFLQSAVRSFLAGTWGDLVPRFRSIAFFQDGPAAGLNAAIIIAIGIVAIGIWNLVIKK